MSGCDTTVDRSRRCGRATAAAGGGGGGSGGGTPVVREGRLVVAASRAADPGRGCRDIVDAGGGAGGFAVPLASLGHSVTVIDPSPDSLAAAQRRAAEQNVPLRAVQGEAADLAALAGAPSADPLLCHNGLRYVDSPPAATAAAAAARPP